MDLRVRNKGYLIVGGTSGMGLAAAAVLAADGADLVIAGRNADKAHAAAAELAAIEGAGRVLGLAADVAQPDGADPLVSTAVDFLGGLDGVAITSGLIGHEPFDMPEEHWRATFDDVLMSVVRVARTALPHLVSRGGGTFVTTSAFSIHSPQAARIPYTALKSAVATVTKGIAKDYGKHNVRANCIAPGAIETDGLHALRAKLATETGRAYDEALEHHMIEEWGMNIALRRPGQPHEVGELIAFLLSPLAGYVTGALINIDGGSDF
ncbi:MAG: SDR family NAD(P)-dependent oxidoreductase [Acidimicrobiia bacterium]